MSNKHSTAIPVAQINLASNSNTVYFEFTTQTQITKRGKEK